MSSHDGPRRTHGGRSETQGRTAQVASLIPGIFDPSLVLSDHFMLYCPRRGRPCSVSVQLDLYRGARGTEAGTGANGTACVVAVWKRRRAEGARDVLLAAVTEPFRATAVQHCSRELRVTKSYDEREDAGGTCFILMSPGEEPAVVSRWVELAASLGTARGGLPLQVQAGHEVVEGREDAVRVHLVDCPMVGDPARRRAWLVSTARVGKVWKVVDRLVHREMKAIPTAFVLLFSRPRAKTLCSHDWAVTDEEGLAPLSSFAGCDLFLTRRPDVTDDVEALYSWMSQLGTDANALLALQQWSALSPESRMAALPSIEHAVSFMEPELVAALYAAAGCRISLSPWAVHGVDGALELVWPNPITRVFRVTNSNSSADVVVTVVPPVVEGISICCVPRSFVVKAGGGRGSFALQITTKPTRPSNFEGPPYSQQCTPKAPANSPQFQPTSLSLYPPRGSVPPVRQRRTNSTVSLDDFPNCRRSPPRPAQAPSLATPEPAINAAIRDRWFIIRLLCREFVRPSFSVMRKSVDSDLVQDVQRESELVERAAEVGELTEDEQNDHGIEGELTRCAAPFPADNCWVRPALPLFLRFRLSSARGDGEVRRAPAGWNLSYFRDSLPPSPLASRPVSPEPQSETQSVLSCSPSGMLPEDAMAAASPSPRTRIPELTPEQIKSIEVLGSIADGTRSTVKKVSMGSEVFVLKAIHVGGRDFYRRDAARISVPADDTSSVCSSEAAGDCFERREIIGDILSSIAALDGGRHPGIVRPASYFVDESSNDLCVLSPHYPLGDLWRVVSDSSVALPWVLRVKIALDVAQVLHHCHDGPARLCHRNLKAENVLLSSLDCNLEWLFSPSLHSRYNALVCDFGTSSDPNPSLLRAPECYATSGDSLRGGTAYSPRADIWAFGLLLYTLVTRSQPFGEVLSLAAGEGVAEEESSQRLDEMVREGLRPSLTRVPPDCPPWFSELMQACWKHEPWERPSALRLVQSLTTGIRSIYTLSRVSHLETHRTQSQHGPLTRSQTMPSSSSASAIASLKQERTRSAAGLPLLITRGRVAAGRRSSEQDAQSTRKTWVPKAMTLRTLEQVCAQLFSIRKEDMPMLRLFDQKTCVALTDANMVHKVTSPPVSPRDDQDDRDTFSSPRRSSDQARLPMLMLLPAAESVEVSLTPFRSLPCGTPREDGCAVQLGVMHCSATYKNVLDCAETDPHVLSYFAQQKFTPPFALVTAEGTILPDDLPVLKEATRSSSCSSVTLFITSLRSMKHVEVRQPVEGSESVAVIPLWVQESFCVDSLLCDRAVRKLAEGKGCTYVLERALAPEGSTVSSLLSCTGQDSLCMTLAVEASLADRDGDSPADASCSSSAANQSGECSSILYELRLGASTVMLFAETFLTPREMLQKAAQQGVPQGRTLVCADGLAPGQDEPLDPAQGPFVILESTDPNPRDNLLPRLVLATFHLQDRQYCVSAMDTTPISVLANSARAKLSVGPERLLFDRQGAVDEDLTLQDVDEPEWWFSAN